MFVTTEFCDKYSRPMMFVLRRLFQNMESIKRVIGRPRLRLLNGNVTTLSDSTAAGRNFSSS